jgi:hypothetical protein
MPIVSSEALRRMSDHDDTAVDNVLVEWILAIECFKSKKSCVERIFPILSGSFDVSTNISNDLLKEGVINRLPELKPRATLELVTNLLKENNVDISAQFENYTVKNIVVTVTEFMSFCVWTAKKNNPVFIVAEACHHTIALLRNCTFYNATENNHHNNNNSNNIDVNVTNNAAASKNVALNNNSNNTVPTVEEKNVVSTSSNKIMNHSSTTTTIDNGASVKTTTTTRPLNAIIEDLKQSVGFDNFIDVSKFICDEMMDIDQKKKFALLKTLKDKVFFIAEVVGVSVEAN